MYEINIELPEHVDNIIKILEDNGYEAYAVGGCIRDVILGRTPNDWDITTSALPKDVKRLFKRTVDTGIEHGTVTVLINDKSYEVTTYRTDGEYKDSRHPENVEFVKELKEDLLRRDFTINAMAFNYEKGLQDPFGGYEDLKKKVIRCVGNPMERLSEDALRILRAVRFSAQLSFEIDEETENAIRILAPNLSKISAERICTELIKLIVSDHPEYLKKAYELGITKVILPELDIAFKTPQNNKYHIYSVGDHIIKTVQSIKADKVLRLTMLLHDIGKPESRKTDSDGVDHFKGHAEISVEMADAILKRLKMDNDTIRKVKILIKYHDLRFPAEIKNVRRAMNKIGTEMFPDFIKVQTADTLGKGDYGKEKMLEHLERIKELYGDVLKENQCVTLKQLAITGKDVMSLGLKPGPAVGELLNEALNLVIDDPEKNEKQYLLNYILRIIHKKV